MTQRVCASGHNTGIRRHALPCLLGLAALAALWPADAFTQSSDAATAIIRSLAPIAGQTVAPVSRASVIVGETAIHVDVARSVSLEVYFAYGSAEITRRAKDQLAAVGRALSSEKLTPYRYLVAGHTDAAGSDAYNLDLSQRRAFAVRNYLISAFPIDPQRLMIAGFGFRNLKTPEAPHAAINRRVEVALIIP